MANLETNYSEEMARIKNIFLSSGEQEYFDKLLKDPDQRAIHDELIKMDPEYLASRAKIVLDQVENGKINSAQDMQTAEYALVHYFAAIKDIEAACELAK